MNNDLTEAITKYLIPQMADGLTDISNSLDSIEERLRRINESIDTHTEEVRMIDV